ncbi:gamma-glutamyltranspeptidase / glutathione hydrolase [Ketogulonicigenium robustum]|uniref:Gamma-glutamyltranspeptidase / glutathione hydrolase n=1 Tax=Ketogulonicigenium robustum TaxID=92947 RepID=A0A1W6P0L7_9RHOB|nr:gamma-glutamyltransferase family protein [Ketogulonicigenium robustum]ARO14870.1 gamma-glutamyltranspeptidase / glutathione hydrolase [Ketogulonicigenium robustum]
MDYGFPYTSQRSPVLGRNVVATSQPLAAQAGLQMLLRGGSAADAAVAAAMVLTVVEPTGCGVGSDAFALYWDGTSLQGLNASGRAPGAWTPDYFGAQGQIPARGWNAVTVPGAVSGWIALHQRYGRLPLADVAAPAIGYARDGFTLSPIIATLWANGARQLKDQPGFADEFMPGGHVPVAGDIIRRPALARTLHEIASTAGESFYRGDLARKMVDDAARHGGAMTMADLDAHRADWVTPLAQPFGGALVHEIPPNGQGIATLIALGLLGPWDITAHDVDSVAATHLMIEATKLALADADRFVADVDAMEFTPDALLAPDYLAARSQLIDPAVAGAPGHGAPRPGGTVYLTAADADGHMVSFIQSNYMGFGSGVVVPDTGISLQNRGAGFNVQAGHPNCVAPHKRPFHTIIPGFVTTADGTAPLMSFGVMGGPMQAQGHLQMAVRVLAYGQNPQAAADAPRWRVLDGRRVAVEATFPPALVDGLRALGHDIIVESPDGVFGFGGAQLIVAQEGGYVAGSDPRKDGQAVAF